MTKTTASSKNLFTFNHINKTIVGTEHHFNQAGIPNSTAYKALMAAMELQPTYSLAPIASTKKVEKKQTYKGLDMGLMADYIRVFGNEQVKAEFNHMVEDKKITYPTIKSWFLEEFKHFNVNQAKAQIAKSDGNICQAEIEALKEVATAMGLSAKEVESMLNLGGDTLENAYKVLEIEPTATDDEVKQAYRKLALKHHPDRVATLGEDVKKAAEEKFQQINNAKDRIYKARGLK